MKANHYGGSKITTCKSILEVETDVNNGMENDGMECNEIEQCLDEIEEGTIHVKIIQDMARITVYKIWYVFLGLVEYYDVEEAALNDSSILMDDSLLCHLPQQVKILIHHMQ